MDCVLIAFSLYIETDQIDNPKHCIGVAVEVQPILCGCHLSDPPS